MVPINLGQKVNAPQAITIKLRAIKIIMKAFPYQTVDQVVPIL